jgi:phage-related protein
MKNVYLILIGLFATSCATVGSVIEGGKDIAMTTVDTTVKTVGSVSSAALKDVSGVVNTVAETYEGVIDTVVENIDEQTDELQDKPEESK